MRGGRRPGTGGRRDGAGRPCLPRLSVEGTTELLAALAEGASDTTLADRLGIGPQAIREARRRGLTERQAADWRARLRG